MTDEMKASVIKAMKALYPELFDDDNADAVVDTFVTQAWLKCQQYDVDKQTMALLIQLWAAHLLYAQQNVDGQATTVKADVFQVSTADSGGTDIYLNQFEDMLATLGLGGWKVQFL